MKMLVLLSIVACASAAVTVQKATVVLGQSDTIKGVLTFETVKEGVKVTGTITGVPAGQHGFHIHELGDLSEGCKSTGSHFNPQKKNHGDINANERHVGDLGNVVADETNTITVDIVDRVISLNGDWSIVGRAVVLHEDPDDLGKGNQNDSLTTGHAGSRLACGVVGRS